MIFPAGPLAMTIDVEALEAWLAGAETGDTIVYATGPTLPSTSATAILSRALVADRLVTPFQRRNPVTRAIEYVLRKRAAELDPIPAGGRRDTAGGDDDPDTRVMRALSRAANLQQMCPTNMELARTCKLVGRNGEPDPDAASYRVGKLIDAGRVRVESQGPNRRRIVTIVASGQRTVPGAL